MSGPESPNLSSKSPSPPDSPSTIEYLKMAYARSATLTAAREALAETRYIFVYPRPGRVEIEELRPPGDQITILPVGLDQYYAFQLLPPYADYEDRWDLFISKDETEIRAQNPNVDPQDGDDKDERAKDAKRPGAINLVLGLLDWYKQRNGHVKMVYLKKTDLTSHADCTEPRERVLDEARRRLQEAEEKTEGNKEEEEW